jgi:hypothetical protein
MPIPTWICPTHDLVYGAKPRHSRGRRKLGEKDITYLDKEVFSSSYLENLEFESPHLATLKTVFNKTFTFSY